MFWLEKSDKEPFPLTFTWKSIGTLSPQKDITPYESIGIAMMLVAVGASAIDFQQHIKDFGLERHFKKEV